MLIAQFVWEHLYISLQRKVDMNQVLKNPLTSVLFSLSHVDATMLSTLISALLTYLETKGTTAVPDKIAAQIIEAAFFFFTFTRISQLILAA